MSKGKKIAAWGLQILLAALFAMAAMPKLTGDAETAANFERWGMPDKMYLLIGALELAGAVGLLIPRLAGLAAVGLFLIMGGALFTHVRHGEFSMAPVPLVFMILLAVVAFLRNPLTSLFAGSAKNAGEA